MQRQTLYEETKHLFLLVGMVKLDNKPATFYFNEVNFIPYGEWDLFFDQSMSGHVFDSLAKTIWKTHGWLWMPISFCAKHDKLP